MTPKTRKEKDPAQIVAEYNADLERWRAKDAHYKDIQPLKLQDVMFMRQMLHPTSKQDSKDLTRALINFICDKGICTAQNIYDELGYSDKPVLRRLKQFQQFGLVRRESKKWYLPTPRMFELRKKYLHRVCG